MSHVQWDDGGYQPPPELQVPILNVKIKAIVRSLGPPKCCWCHWVNGRSRPCLGSDCQFCRASLPRHRQGYMPAMQLMQDPEGHRYWRKVVVSIPDGAVSTFADPRLVGKALHVSRLQHKLSLDKTEECHSECPPSFDVKPIIEIRERKNVASEIPPWPNGSETPDAPAAVRSSEGGVA